MLDFTSALYLGLRHPTGSLRPWQSLTTGRPAALLAPPLESAVATRLAGLVGQQAALLAPSTLHLMWDLFGLLTSDPVALIVDEGIYPIGLWGVERATARGVPVRRFAHHDAAGASAALRWAAANRRRPLVVSDGFCPGCGKAAPLRDYLRSLRRFQGELIIDDSQALGILGRNPLAENPYGHGGAGTLAWLGLEGQEAVVICSLAKGFGAPVAGLMGPERWIRRFSRESETRVHASAPSAAAIASAERALDLNERNGDRLRTRLANLVRRFRSRMAALGLSPRGGNFPVQSLGPASGLDTVAIHAALRARGVNTVLHRPHGGRGTGLSFLLTAAHSERDIDRAATALANALAPARAGVRWRLLAPAGARPA